MKRHLLQNLKKVLAVFLAVAMAAMCVPEAAFTAQAEGDVAETGAEGSAAEGSDELDTYASPYGDSSKPYLFAFGGGDCGEEVIENRIRPNRDNFQAEWYSFYSDADGGYHIRRFEIYESSNNREDTYIYVRVPRGKSITVSPDQNGTWIKSLTIDTEATIDFQTRYYDGTVGEYTCYKVDMKVDGTLGARTDVMTVSMEGVDYPFTFREVSGVYKKNGSEEWVRDSMVPVVPGDKFQLGIKVSEQLLQAGTQGPQIIGNIRTEHVHMLGSFEVSDFGSNTEAAAAWASISQAMNYTNPYTQGNGGSGREFFPIFTYGNDGTGKTTDVYFPEVTVKDNAWGETGIAFELPGSYHESKSFYVAGYYLQQDNAPALRDETVSLGTTQNTLKRTQGSDSSPRFYLKQSTHSVNAETDGEYYFAQNSTHTFSAIGSNVNFSGNLIIGRDPGRGNQVYVEPDFSSAPPNIWDQEFDPSFSCRISRQNDSAFDLNLSYTNDHKLKYKLEGGNSNPPQNENNIKINLHAKNPDGSDNTDVTFQQCDGNGNAIGDNVTSITAPQDRFNKRSGGVPVKVNVPGRHTIISAKAYADGKPLGGPSGNAKVDLEKQIVTLGSGGKVQLRNGSQINLDVTVAPINSYTVTIDAAGSAVEGIALSYKNGFGEKQVLIVDENGDPILDEDGDEMYETREEAIPAPMTAPVISDGTATVSNRYYTELSFRLMDEDVKYLFVEQVGADSVERYEEIRYGDDPGSGCYWYVDEDGITHVNLEQITENATIRVIAKNSIGGTDKGITWNIDAEGKLTATGTYAGGTPTYNEEEGFMILPWSDYKDEIRSAEISIQGMTTARGMFATYRDLTSIDLSGFGTNGITDMAGMFYNDFRLEEINLGDHFTTANVTCINGMFFGCRGLTSLDLSGFDLDKCVFGEGFVWVEGDEYDTLRDMLEGCENLTSIKTPLHLKEDNLLPGKGRWEGWFMQDGTVKSGLPKNAAESVTLTKGRVPVSATDYGITWGIDVEGILTAEGTYTGDEDFSFGDNVWGDCASIIKTAVIKIKGLKNGDGLFSNWRNLESIDLSGFDTTQMTCMSNMFEGCTILESVNLSGFDTRNVTNMSGMFMWCGSLKSVDLSSFNTSKVTSMELMFEDCRSLKSIDLSGWDTRNVTNMDGMFIWCPKLESLDLSSFDMSSLRDPADDPGKQPDYEGDDFWEFCNELFGGCDSLVKIETPRSLKWDIELPGTEAEDDEGERDEHDIWYQPDGTPIQYLPKNQLTSITIGRNKVYKDEYTVIFDLQGHGTAINNQPVFVGEKVTKPADPTAEGYTFGGWYKEAACTNAWSFDVDKVTGPTTLYAKWTENKKEEPAVKTYTVTFNVDGGSAVVEQTIEEGKTATKPADPTRDGFTFGGWYKETACTNAWDFDKDTVTADTTLYAKWTPAAPAVAIYTVTFNVDGGSAVAAQTVEEGGTATKPADPTKEGCKFGGWYTSVTFDMPFDFTTAIKADTTVYAKWYTRGMSIDLIADQVYTGSAIKPEVKVYDGADLLREKTDYTVSYKNNTNVGTATVTVTGKGDYTGRKETTFEIVPLSIEGDDFSASAPWYNYTGSSITPVPTVKFGSKTLKNGTDYEVEVGGCVEEGTYTFTVKGKGNFTGSREVIFGITKATLMTDSKIKVTTIKSVKYTGEALEPAVTVRYSGKTLQENEDYTVSYRDNVDAGKGVVIITGTGENYAGVREVMFTITGTPLKNARIGGTKNIEYTGDPVQQDSFTVTCKGDTLEEEQDYTVSYLKNVEVGTATMVLTGKGGYTGTLKKTFRITAFDISGNTAGKFEASLQETSYPYEKGGAAPKPVVTFDGEPLREKVDYTLSYSGNKTAGSTATVTIKGKGSFKGSTRITFSVTQQDLDEVFMTVPDIKYKSGKGKYISKPVLIDTNGSKLKAGTDYEKTVTYALEDGTELGAKATVSREDADVIITATVTGKGQYTGTKSVSYRLTKKAFSPKKLKIKEQEYTGDPVILEPEDVTAQNMSYGTDFEIVEDSYVNNVKKGTASVIIRGLGEYGGQKTVKFAIKAKQILK